MPALNLQRQSKGFPRDDYDLELIGLILPRAIGNLRERKADIESRMTENFDRQISLQLDAVLAEMEQRENGSAS